MSRVLSALALLIFTPALADPGVFRGPYLSHVTDDGVTVLWETPTPAAGVVRYGVDAVDEHEVTSGPAAVHQEVRLSGL